MKIEGVTLIHFSPLGKTRETLLNIARGIGCETMDEIDLSRFEARWQSRVIPAGQLVLFGMPVYSGRLPPIAKEVFNHIYSAGALAIAVVVFGNRDFDDALLELKNNLDVNGFQTIGAAAFVAEHAMNPHAGTGRPDRQDIDQQLEFGRQIRAKLGSEAAPEKDPLAVPGHFPYKNLTDLPVAPIVSDACNQCGQCIRNCPTASIDPQNPARSDAYRCILCLRCVKNCPVNARTVVHEKLNLTMDSLSLFAARRKEPTIIL